MSVRGSLPGALLVAMNGGGSLSRAFDGIEHLLNVCDLYAYDKDNIVHGVGYSAQTLADAMRLTGVQRVVPQSNNALNYLTLHWRIQVRPS